MSHTHQYSQSIIIGFAAAASLLAGAASLFFSRKEKRTWMDKAREAATQVIGTQEIFNKPLILGGVAGGLVGVTAALLLAPKSGADLRKDITHPFKHNGQHPKPSAHKKPLHALSPRRQSTSHAVHQSVDNKKIKKMSPQKKSAHPPRRKV